MEVTYAAQSFTDRELDMLDAALDRVPTHHKTGSSGIRELVRIPYLTRGRQSYPTVMAIYSSGTGTGVLYDAAFMGAFGPADLIIPLPDFAIHAVVGCCVAQDHATWSAWTRRNSRQAPRNPPGLLVLEKELATSALSCDRDTLRIEGQCLPDGIDFALLYASFLSFPDLLARGMPSEYQFLHAHVFCPPRAGRSVLGERGLSL